MTDALAKLQASGRGWNSWVSEWPAQMSQLPRGLTLTPVAYASSKNAFTDFPTQGGAVRYGSRSVRGEQIALMVSLEMLGYYDDRAGSQRYPPLFR